MKILRELVDKHSVLARSRLIEFSEVELKKNNPLSENLKHYADVKKSRTCFLLNYKTCFNLCVR